VRADQPSVCALLARVRQWLRPGGKLFGHVFSHRTAPYRFDHAERGDWIAKHFFTGGIMPSHGLGHQPRPAAPRRLTA
jgi:cyclopropane-fatty-acyl-phospholipid synthase